MNSCVFPGSFDPVTVGHLDLIRRAAAQFDLVTVTVMINVRKKSSISLEKRVDFLQRACQGLPNVNIDSWDGLLTEYLNRLLAPETETWFIPASEGLGCVSSSAVRELAAFRGNIHPFVPSGLAEEIAEALSNVND